MAQSLPLPRNAIRILSFVGDVGDDGNNPVEEVEDGQGSS
jgi:hypothetical protein